MKKILKQSIGIDCAKDDFVASFGKYASDFKTQIVATQTFKNTKEGFQKLQKWTIKLSLKDSPLHFVMEATGVYHERLACFLFDAKYPISVVLPQRAKNFAKTLKTKTVTDKQASKSLTVMGLEKNLDLWQKPDGVYIQLKQLTREREQLQKHQTVAKNQLHAEEAGAWPSEKSIKRLKCLLEVLKKQITETERDIKTIVAANPKLDKKIKQITSAPAIGLITAVTVIGETNGFNLIRNKRQLVSYAGYDVVEKLSGTSVHGKAHISHRGNRHIRKAMYMPALTAIRHTDHNKELFKRLVGKHGIKMKAVVAVQRKLLTLIYTLWKKNEYYDESYYGSTVEHKKMEQPTWTTLNELDSVCF